MDTNIMMKWLEARGYTGLDANDTEKVIEETRYIALRTIHSTGNNIDTSVSDTTDELVRQAEAVERKQACTLRYVNAYETYRSYGGPEYGGWYENGVVLASIPVDSDEAEASMLIYLKMTLLKRIQYIELKVVVEEHIAANYPIEHPHYE